MAGTGARALGKLLLGVLGVALAAQVSVPVPGSSVPQSLQTLAVVVAGMWLGPRGGGLALALYVVVGAAGLPVFADGGAGTAHLLGPTLGYLLGFIAGAALAGWWVRRPWGRTLTGVLAGALVAHLVILVSGWVRLAALTGGAAAFAAGVAPFLLGSLVKSVAAALAWLLLRPRVEPGEADLVA